MKASTIISDLEKANDDQLRKIGWGVRIHHLERKQMEGVKYGNSGEIQKWRDRGKGS